MNQKSAQCQSVAESEALERAARGGWGAAGKACWKQ